MCPSISIPGENERDPPGEAEYWDAMNLEAGAALG